MTIWHYFLLILLFFAAIIGLLQRQRRKQNATPTLPENPFNGDTALPYVSRPIMTQTELQVYDKLLRALPDYMVFAQVQVSRVIESPSENNLYWFNFINRLSYDFVICRTDGTPIAAIEIDDDTHEMQERQEADTRKDLATQAAQIEILRWDVREIPAVKTIAKTIAQIDENHPN